MRDGLAGEMHLASGHRQGAGKYVEERRLAGAVWTDQRADLAFIHRERDVVDGGQAAVSFHDVAGFQDNGAVERRTYTHHGDGGRQWSFRFGGDRDLS